MAEDHFNAVKVPILDRLSKILHRNGFKDSVWIQLNPAMVIQINFYLNPANLKDLIMLKPADLFNKVKDLNINDPDFIDSNTPVFKLFKRVFLDYGYDEIDKHNFVSKINIDTCPYCNRNYIYTLDKAGKIKPEIDHFYPKDKYPLLAACYYNLVPSCQTCNGFGGKHISDPYQTGAVSPYMLNNSDFLFSFKLNSLARINPISGKSSIDIFFDKVIAGNNTTFKLDTLYQKHTDHILELIVKSKLKYSEKYRAYLHSYPGLKFSDIEIDQLILGNYSREKDIHKRPLAKLYQDIGRKLDLIK